VKIDDAPFNEPELVPIERAYYELSHTAFSAWIMLAATRPDNLSSKAYVSRTLGHSIGHTNKILLELVLRNYVWIHAKEKNVGSKRPVSLRKKPLIAGVSQFVKLNNFRTPTGQFEIGSTLPPEKTETVENAGEDTQMLCQHAKTHFTNFYHQTQNTSGATPVQHGKCEWNGFKTDRHKFVQSPLYSINRPTISKGIYKPKHPKRKDVGSQNSNPTISRGSEIRNQFPIPLYSFIEKVSKKNQERKEKEKRRRSLLAQKKSQIQAGLAPDIDWSELDQRGEPKISFAPSDDERRRMIKVLDRSATDRHRQRMVRKLGIEFMRIYTRYRKALLIQRGAIASAKSFSIHDKERPHAQAAGEMCIRKEVTPRQVLTYWHYNIKSFAQKGLKLPSLSFLSSPANIESVACADLDEIERQQELKKRNAARPARGDGFDPSDLDRRIRPVLLKAGFDLDDWDDRALMTIQAGARTVAMGVKIFISSNMKPMVMTVARELYGWEDK